MPFAMITQEVRLAARGFVLWYTGTDPTVSPDLSAQSGAPSARTDLAVNGSVRIDPTATNVLDMFYGRVAGVWRSLRSATTSYEIVRYPAMVGIPTGPLLAAITKTGVYTAMVPPDVPRVIEIGVGGAFTGSVVVTVTGATTTGGAVTWTSRTLTTADRNVGFQTTDAFIAPTSITVVGQMTAGTLTTAYTTQVGVPVGDKTPTLVALAGGRHRGLRRPPDEQPRDHRAGRDPRRQPYYRDRLHAELSQRSPSDR